MKEAMVHLVLVIELKKKEENTFDLPVNNEL